MPSRTHIQILARRLTTQLAGKAFLTIERTTITDMLRRVSNEPTTRIKSRLARDLTEALDAHGIGVYPPLDQTTTGDTVRLYHVDSVFGHLVDVILRPDPATDSELGEMILKVKGKWRWSSDGYTRNLVTTVTKLQQ